MRPLLHIGILWMLAGTPLVEAATIEVRRQDGETRFTAELGQVVDMEVVIDADQEELTGYTFFISLPAGIFGILPASKDESGATQPFAPSGFLRGIPLLNRVEEVGDELFLSYTEAASGARRSRATGQGVAARFRLEVLRRPLQDEVQIRVEERGHDRVSHYVRDAAPGVEQRFAEPLGAAIVRVVGFRIKPLPDLQVIEGESQVVFDLDAFVDTSVADVIWTNSRLAEIPTRIDPDTREVSMSPLAGVVGEFGMIFSAFEVNEGLTASDTVHIRVLSKPKISSFPDTVRFAEDESNQEFDLDAFAEDADHPNSALVWRASGGQNTRVAIDSSSHVALFEAEPDYFGDEVLSFVVEDPTGLSDTVQTVVAVAPVNDPPEMLRATPVYPVQGSGAVAVPLSRLVTDRDDDVNSLQFFLEAEPGVRVEIAEGKLLVHGEGVGRSVVRITAQDTSGAVAQGRQVAVVLEPGETVKPEIDRLPELRFRGGQSASLDLNERVRDDSPADSLVWTAKADSGLIATVQKGQLQVSGQSGFAGTGKVQLTARDPKGNEGRAQLQASVLRPGDDLGPRIFHPGKIGLRSEEEVELALDDLVSDPDHTDAEMSWAFFPSAGLDIEFDEQSRVLRLRAGEEPVEPASLGLVVTDPSDASHEITAPVLLVAPGDPPQVAELPVVSLDSLQAEVAVDLDDFAFDDEDSEAELLWSAEPEPGVEAELDPVSHVLRLRRAPIQGGQAPTATQVLLKVLDTAGQERSVLLTVGLPPLFDLRPLPEIQLFPDQVDSSIVLDQFVIATSSRPPTLAWKASPSDKVAVAINPATRRVRLQLADPSFQGNETITFTATDATGRSLSTSTRVVAKGRGLAPQLRAFPRLELEEGQVDATIDLDDFVVDDDADSLLKWSATGQRTLKVGIDSLTHVLTLDAGSAQPGVEQIQFLVRDLAGNAAIGLLEVIVVRGGQPPIVSGLPQVLLTAGEPEQQLLLDPFVSDADTPDAQISWEVSAEPGVAARVDNRRLFLSVPADQRGTRKVRLTARDPQGNQTSADLEILIQGDDVPPELVLEVRRHPVFNELVEIEVRPSEMLREAPQVRVDGGLEEAEPQEDGSYVAAFEFPPEERERSIDISVRAADPSGNEVQRQLSAVLSWMDEGGGNVRGPDTQLLLNVPDAASGPGRLALIYRLGEQEEPPDSEDRPVYSLDLLRGRSLEHPVTLNFFTGEAGSDLGILRWDAAARRWEEVPTLVDEEKGWLSAPVRKLGLFRLGPVSPENRSEPAQVRNYPNPFAVDGGGNAQFVYQVTAPGRVRLEVFNSLGQPVRLLVDEFQEVGVWNALWNGRDQEGRPVSSGVYFYELREGGQRHRRSLVLIR